MKESITVDDVLDVLNRATEADPEAMRALVRDRVPCNQQLADDPTIQVGVKRGSPRVGLLGIINGLFGIDGKGWGPIMAEVEVGTQRVKRFVRVGEPMKEKVPDRLGYSPKDVP